MSAKATKPKEPAYVAATLRWCNARRKEQGLKPVVKLPKGWRGDANTCPCGKLIGKPVWSESWGGEFPFTSTGILPAQVSAFVAAFDAGRLPQYDASL